MAVDTTFMTIMGDVFPLELKPLLEARLNEHFDTKGVQEPYNKLMVMYFLLPKSSVLYEKVIKTQSVRRNKLNKAIFLEVSISKEECEDKSEQMVELLFNRTIVRANEEIKTLKRLGVYAN